MINATIRTYYLGSQRLGSSVPAIIHVNFPTQAELMGSFLKVQEFYESPEFAGKAFTRAEFEAWYMKSRNATSFTYLQDWTGCNVPGRTVAAFTTKPGFVVESHEEEDFMDFLISACADHGDNFALIGTYTGGETSLRHEFAHALYALDKDYRSLAKLTLEQVPMRIMGDIYNFLEKKGYGSNVFNDEAHAYIMDDAYELIHLARTMGYHISDPAVTLAGEQILAVYNYLAARYGLKT